LGQLVGSIITYFYYCGKKPPINEDITIPSIKKNQNFLSKFNEEEKRILRKYSLDYGIFNPVRHDDVHTFVSYLKTVKFVLDSNRIVELVVRNKDKFINN
jgi:hypothetical protein